MITQERSETLETVTRNYFAFLDALEWKASLTLREYVEGFSYWTRE